MRTDADLEASATMTAALRTLSFPTSKDEAIANVGHLRLADGVELGDILQGLRVDAFHDRAVAAKAVDRHWAVVAKALAQIDAAERAAAARDDLG